jgi:hypothetical protein
MPRVDIVIFFELVLGSCDRGAHHIVAWLSLFQRLVLSTTYLLFAFLRHTQQFSGPSDIFVVGWAFFLAFLGFHKFERTVLAFFFGLKNF